MQKDTYYFSHDSNAKDDPKCMLLIDQLGLEGYGIYWVLIETLRDQPEYKYPIKLLPVLAKRYFTSAEKFMAVVSNYQLFYIEDETFFFSKSLNQRMKPLEENREKRRLAGIKSGEVRRLKAGKETEQETNTCSTSDEQTPNKNEQSKVKESKEEESKEEESKKNTITHLQANERVDYEKFKEYFNLQANNKIPVIKLLTQARKDLIKNRIKEHGKKTLKEVIEKALQSNFLTSNTDGNWGKANFDWIMKQANFVKILEGVYDNTPKKHYQKTILHAPGGLDLDDLIREAREFKPENIESS